jgi:hypothetical protein
MMQFRLYAVKPKKGSCAKLLVETPAERRIRNPDGPAKRTDDVKIQASEITSAVHRARSRCLRSSNLHGHLARLDLQTRRLAARAERRQIGG